MIRSARSGKICLYGIIGLLCAALPTLTLIAILSSPATARGSSIVVQWKRPVNQPVSLSMSTGSRYFGSVDRDGTVRFYNKSGRLIWKRRVEGATDVLIARNGQNIIVYSRANPEIQEVYFYRGDGRLLWKHRVEGSVESGDVSSDGIHAAITTSEKYIYVYTPDPIRPKYRRWRLDGVGYRVAFTPNNERIIVGTLDESALVCYDTQGRFQWRCRNSADRRYELSTSADGRRILGLLPATRENPGIEVCLWDSGGKRLWRRSLDAFDARALISPKSRYVAVSYAHFVSKEGEGIVGRKVAVYNSSGDLLWEKGGLFFAPELVALSPTGSSVIVSDGERSLYNMDRRGKILSKHTLGGTVRKTVSSDDGRTVLLYCGDGWLYLMQVG